MPTSPGTASGCRPSLPVDRRPVARRGVRPKPSLAMALLAVLLLCSCTDGAAGTTAGAAPPPSVRVTTATPGPLTTATEPDAMSAALDVSRVLFRTAPVVVVARDDDQAGILLGASSAVALGVPLLVQPASPPARALTAELDRLQATTILAVGSVDASALRAASSVAVLPVAATPRALVRAGVPLSGSRSVTAADVTGEVAALSGDTTPALEPAVGTGTAAAPSAPASGAATSSRLPPVTRGGIQRTTLVLATGEPASAAALGTARAAGAQVQLTGGVTDPRASTDVLTALARSRPQAVLAVGAGFADEPGLPWELATAENGRQLPRGGQVLFPGHTLVALYGAPGTGALGVLGEQDLPATIRRAQATAAPYASLIPGPVVPTFEIIATIASSGPGADGDYSSETDPARLRPWIEAAAEAGIYVVLDLQPGRSDFLSQAQRYQSLLEQPDVGLALDPEWRLGPGQRPLQQIGSVDVEEINEVVTWLADLTRRERLPQKLLVLHQFRSSMIRGRDRLDTSRRELAITLHADGQGGQASKQDTWQELHRDLPPGRLFWGWKNFYDEDHPVLTPGETVAEVRPTPALISYQ